MSFLIKFPIVWQVYYESGLWKSLNVINILSANKTRELCQSWLSTSSSAVLLVQFVLATMQWHFINPVKRGQSQILLAPSHHEKRTHTHAAPTLLMGFAGWLANDCKLWHNSQKIELPSVSILHHIICNEIKFPFVFGQLTEIKWTNRSHEMVSAFEPRHLLVD